MRQANGGVVAADKAMVAIRVLQRINVHQGIGQYGLGALTAIGQQVVGQRHGGIGRADFITMQGTGNPDAGRQPLLQGAGLGGGQAARISQPAHIGFNLIKPRNMVRAADHRIK